MSTVRRCGRISRECRFVDTRMGSIRGSGGRVRGLVASLAGRVGRIFIRDFSRVGGGFACAFGRLFNNNATSLSLTSPRGVLADKVSVLIRPPNGVIVGLRTLSNNRGTLITVTLCFTVVGMEPTPFYMVSRVRTTLSSMGICHFTTCLHEVASGARFVLVARHHNAVRRTSILCNIAVRSRNVSGLLRLHSARITRGLNVSSGWLWKR